MHASEFLKDAAGKLGERAAEYDPAAGGERSAAAVARMWSAATGKDMTEREAWLFLLCLKAVRAMTAPAHHQDSCTDLTAYAALFAESDSARTPTPTVAQTVAAAFDGLRSAPAAQSTPPTSEGAFAEFWRGKTFPALAGAVADCWWQSNGYWLRWMRAWTEPSLYGASCGPPMNGARLTQGYAWVMRDAADGYRPVAFSSKEFPDGPEQGQTVRGHPGPGDGEGQQAGGENPQAAGPVPAGQCVPGHLPRGL